MLYRDAGVDIEAGEELVRFLVENNPFIGGFAGGVDAGFLRNYREPVLFAATDGIGTKIILGQRTGLLDGLGQDLVAMCVNDLVTVNAKPLFFLDYYATGKLELAVAKRLLKSVISALESIDCPLIGGETAELPGMVEGFDVAGFAVGVAEKSLVPRKEDIEPGMLVVGLRSSGPHSNGYSLIRKVFEPSDLKGDLAQQLMAPTRLYVREVLRAFEMGAVAAAHITGGGIPGNLVRVLPEGTRAVVELPDIPGVFKQIQSKGDVPWEEMLKTFNMGFGMMLVAPRSEAEAIADHLHGAILGEIVQGEPGVEVNLREP